MEAFPRGLCRESLFRDQALHGYGVQVGTVAELASFGFLVSLEPDRKYLSGQPAEPERVEGRWVGLPFSVFEQHRSQAKAA